MRNAMDVGAVVGDAEVGLGDMGAIVGIVLDTTEGLSSLLFQSTPPTTTENPKKSAHGQGKYSLRTMT